MPLKGIGYKCDCAEFKCFWHHFLSRLVSYTSAFTMNVSSETGQPPYGKKCTHSRMEFIKLHSQCYPGNTILAVTIHL